MKGERKLRLVLPPPSSGASGGEELPPDPAEIERAQRLRDAIELGRDPFVEMLRSAHAPAGIGDADHDNLLERALGGSEVDAAPTAAERRAAEHLRDALEADSEDGEAAELCRALRLAYRPGEIDPEWNEALIRKTLRNRASGAGAGRRAFAFVGAALVGVSAMAAGVALMLRAASEHDPMEYASKAPAAAVHEPLIRSRSTAELFDPSTPFPRSGGESARVDRIAGARASDLRANRFAAWGVR
jgi:hypothetical protein